MTGKYRAIAILGTPWWLSQSGRVTRLERKEIAIVTGGRHWQKSRRQSVCVLLSPHTHYINTWKVIISNRNCNIVDNRGRRTLQSKVIKNGNYTATVTRRHLLSQNRASLCCSTSRLTGVARYVGHLFPEEASVFVSAVLCVSSLYINFSNWLTSIAFALLIRLVPDWSLSPSLLSGQSDFGLRMEAQKENERELIFLHSLLIGIRIN